MSHLRLVHSLADRGAGASQPLDDIEVEGEVSQQPVQRFVELAGVSELAVRALAGGSLEIEKSIPPCSERVRARAVARARAVLAMDSDGLPMASIVPIVPILPAAPMTPPAGPSVTPSRRPRLYFGASVCLAFGIGVVGTVVHDGGAVRLAAAPALPEVAAEAVAPAAAEPRAPAISAPPSPHGVAVKRHGHGASTVIIPPSSCSTESECLKRIWKAFADQDYSAALAGVSEHRRRFPRGQLREERDALQVLSLAGAGHTDEARQASATFGEQFPGSVLSPRIRQALGTD